MRDWFRRYEAEKLRELEARQRQHWVKHQVRQSRVMAAAEKTQLRAEADVVRRELRKRRCGAKTRQGKPCIRKTLENGRCPNHGGLSTGPRTKAGRKRIAAAQRKRWAR